MRGLVVVKEKTDVTHFDLLLLNSLFCGAVACLFSLLRIAEKLVLLIFNGKSQLYERFFGFVQNLLC